MNPILSSADQDALMTLENKLELIRDKTIEVAEGLSNGMFLHGAGGSCKSYTVLSILKELQVHYTHFNSRMTGRSLFDRLEEFPHAVHVLEDLEQILRDVNAQGVLRSALWGQVDGDRQQRLVTWNAFKVNRSFYFTGGIIMIANCGLADFPQLRALATRIDVLHHSVTGQEIAALMRSVAARGYSYMGRRLEPDDCLRVCDYLIAQFGKLQRSPHMRLLVTSFSDFMLWNEGQSHCHWTELVDSRINEQVVVSSGGPGETRDARKRREQAIAREIREAAPNDWEEQARLWRERTGKSKSAYYRRLEDRRS